MAIKFSLSSRSASSKKTPATPPKPSRALAGSPPPCPRPPKEPLKLLTANLFASTPSSKSKSLSTRDAPKGKEFFLKELPRELRDMIYIHYIGNEQPFGNFGKRNNHDEKRELWLRRWRSLLLVCRQTYAEFAPLLYQAAHFTYNVGYLENEGTAIAKTFFKMSMFWKASEVLKENLQQCTVKVEAGWQPDAGSAVKWTFMIEQLTEFLISLPRLHTLYVYVNRSDQPKGDKTLIKFVPTYRYRPRQVAALDAARRAFRLHPAIQHLHITERLEHYFTGSCRTTSIDAQSDGTVTEESYIVHSDGHMKNCELQCVCEDNDMEHEEYHLYEGRDDLPQSKTDQYTMPTILISGAASGIGHAFLQSYAKDTNNQIIAIDRAPIDTTTLYSQAKIETYTVDITSQDSLDAFLPHIQNKPIHLLIHSIGIRGLVPTIEAQNPSNVAAAETLNVMDVETMMRTYNVNTIATFTLLRSLLPNLLSSTPTSHSQTKVVIMGSRMGSMGYNTTGSAYAYRASKAALNSMIKSFSIDVPEVIWVIMHPGRVESGLVMCKEEGAISAEESVTSMAPLIERFAKEDSGKFLDRFGERIEW
ncbi:hypothetical protein BLS_003375 [Venturia inaequalis]|uniref:NAD(P)-binding protein n=1 Tax=Venturia inaequalis TaxID=5025 RepID=A0A8H3V9S9_VENIN|nr:hypothetical protein BLS_003375 [Venturia inaequalis]